MLSLRTTQSHTKTYIFLFDSWRHVLFFRKQTVTRIRLDHACNHATDVLPRTSLPGRHHDHRHLPAALHGRGMLGACSAPLICQLVGDAFTCSLDFVIKAALLILPPFRHGSNSLKYTSIHSFLLNAHPIYISSFLHPRLLSLLPSQLNQISSTLTTATILSYGFVFWYFYLAKLTQCVWFDAEKDMYYILMPYYQSAPITFKAGHVTEIDDLFANLNIRGIKAYCPKELFYDANEYLRMFRSEKGLRR